MRRSAAAYPGGAAALAVLGAALGLTQAAHGLYDETVWGPVALGALVVMLALGTGLGRRIPLAAVLALLSLAIWSLLSSSWGASAEAAWSASARWLLYAAALAAALWLVAADRRRAQGLILGGGAGVLAVGLWLLGRMLTHHGAPLFLGSRLNDPLGYVNGQAGFLLAGVWPCCALAERRRPAAVAGLGMAGLVLLVGLGALTFSRSWELGLAASVLLVGAAVPGRRRRILIVLAVAVAILAIHGPLGHVADHAVVADPVAARAARAIGLAALVAGLGWGLLVAALERLAPDPGATRSRIRRWGSIGLAVLGVVVAGVVAVRAGRIAHAVRTDYRQLVHLAPSPGSARFLAGGGNRYDYWRVAWLEFRDHPVDGVGAGSYAVDYYRHRRTTEAITQPHSIELQTLAELGVLGGLLLLAFLGAVARALGRMARRARTDSAARCIAVAGGGTFAGWLAQTSADWEHLIPGLTLIALASVAGLHAHRDAPPRPLAGRRRALAVALTVLVAGAGAAVIAPRILALQAQSAAGRALRRLDPRAALADATRALRYDGDLVQARVLRAAAFARLDAFGPARADLERALVAEPRNWVTWALLGDLLARRGDREGARAAYRQAARLNPLDPEIAALAASRLPR